MDQIQILQKTVETALGVLLKKSEIQVGQLIVEVRPENYYEACQKLRDDASCQFQIAVDLCGVDYLDYGNGLYDGPRYWVVLQLLSVTLNQRVRLKAACSDDDFPSLPSVVALWPGLNWFEREAFDMYGIMFEDHPDLRRILTDYGFIGHPQRKDFPVSGHVEMIYDEQQKRVIYQPVSIEPREIVPRLIREEGYGGLKH